MSSFIGPTDLPPQLDPPPPPEPKAKREVRDPLRPEQAPRVNVEAICCPNPECRSLKVYKRSRYAGELMSLWQCNECKTTWKEPMESGGDRVAIP